MANILSTDFTKRKSTTVRNLSELKSYSFDARYVCDDTGNVFLIKKITSTNAGIYYNLKRMKPFITRDGYVEYVLTSSKGNKKHIQGHRIVAGLYLPTVKGKDYVNHKDGNRKNNKVSNLEYVTASENTIHSFTKLGKVVWNKGLTKNV